MSQHIYTYDPATGVLDEIAGGGNTNFVGTTAEWEALSSTEKAQYVTVDLTDDFDGASIDPVPTEDSANAVSSGGVYSSIQTLKNDLIILAASYGNYPSSSDNCVEYLKDLLGNTYDNIYSSSVNGAGFANGQLLTALQTLSASITNKTAVRKILIIGIGNNENSDWSTVTLPAMVAFKSYCDETYKKAEVIIVPVSSRNYKSGIDSLFTVYDNMCRSIDTHKMNIMTSVYHILALNYNSYFDSTGGHPNTAGAKLIADAIYEGLNGESLGGTYISYDSSTSSVDNPLCTASSVNNIVYGTQKGFRLVYNIIFVPTESITLSMVWGQGLRLCKSPRIRTAQGVSDFAFAGVLFDWTAKSTFDVRVQHVYDSTLGGYYMSILGNSDNAILDPTHTYHFRAYFEMPFEMV